MGRDLGRDWGGIGEGLGEELEEGLPEVLWEGVGKGAFREREGAGREWGVGMGLPFVENVNVPLGETLFGFY